VKVSHVLIAVKLAVSVALLVWLAGKLDLAASGARLLAADPSLVAIGLGLLIANVAVVALRWWLLLRRLGFTALTFPQALAGTYASVFVGQALPGNVGAEAVRGWVAFTRGGRAGLVAASLVTDRMLAVISLVLVSGLAMVWSWRQLGSGTALHILAAAAVLVALAATVVFLMPMLLGRLARRFRRLKRFADLAGLIRRAALSPAGATGFVLSSAIHVMTSLAVFAAATALGIAIGLVGALVAVPIAILVAALPISIAGWGVREASLAYGLTLYGVPPADAALVSLALGLGLLLASLPGAAAFLTLDLARRAR
jgi:uncharacterized membrane protein YbhN (UPF0104 family)